MRSAKVRIAVGLSSGRGGGALAARSLAAVSAALICSSKLATSPSAFFIWETISAMRAWRCRTTPSIRDRSASSDGRSVSVATRILAWIAASSGGVSCADSLKVESARSRRVTERCGWASLRPMSSLRYFVVSSMAVDTASSPTAIP